MTSYGIRVACLLATLFFLPIRSANSQRLPRNKVQGPSELDWTKVVPHADGNADSDYKADQQSYQYFAPNLHGQPTRLFIYVSPMNKPVEWRYLKDGCVRNGAIFVGPNGVGNRVPVTKRIRIVLDVLHDARHRRNIPPERTYIVDTPVELLLRG